MWGSSRVPPLRSPIRISVTLMVDESFWHVFSEILPFFRHKFHSTRFSILTSFHCPCVDAYWYLILALTLVILPSFDLKPDHHCVRKVTGCIRFLGWDFLQGSHGKMRYRDLQGNQRMAEWHRHWLYVISWERHSGPCGHTIGKSWARRRGSIWLCRDALVYLSPRWQYRSMGVWWMWICLLLIRGNTVKSSYLTSRTPFQLQFRI